MAVQFNNPELQAKVEQWMAQTGRSADELVEDAMAGYFDELAQVRQTLDSRYDDIQNGKVKLIAGDERVHGSKQRVMLGRKNQA